MAFEMVLLAGIFVYRDGLFDWLTMLLRNA